MGAAILHAAAAVIMAAAIVAPAPWTLRGDTYLMLLLVGAEEAKRFVPSELAEPELNGFVWAMFVDYRESPVGPYHELLLIPGTFSFEGGRLPSVTRMYVSSQASVDNGRRNWGLPKQLATFDVERTIFGTDVVMYVDGQRAVELTFVDIPGLGVPVDSSILPESFRMLGQKHEGRTFEFAPTTEGTIRPARVVHAWSDAQLFPVLSRERVIGTIRFNDFEATFPIAATY